MAGICTHPDWFAKKDYRYLLQLDAAGWLHELERCSGLGADLSEWEFIGESGWTDRAYPAFIGPPAVRIVDNANQSTLSAIEKPSLLIQVYLNAPDAVILEEFKKKLQSARQSVPAPVSHPGPANFSAKFTDTHFRNWINRRIVEVCELDAWRTKLPKDEEKPLDADFGRWLFERYADPSKELVLSRRTLAFAIKSIPALAAQITVNSDVTAN